MSRLPIILLGCFVATTGSAQDVKQPAREQPESVTGDSAVSETAKKHALRVRGMRAAIADIERNQLWILNEVRARVDPSGQSCSLQLTLARELHIATDYGNSTYSNVPHPSILDQDVYAIVMPLAVIRGYNDVMWAEIEHRYGAGTRKRIQ